MCHPVIGVFSALASTATGISSIVEQNRLDTIREKNAEIARKERRDRIKAAERANRAKLEEERRKYRANQKKTSEYLKLRAASSGIKFDGSVAEYDKQIWNKSFAPRQYQKPIYYPRQYMGSSFSRSFNQGRSILSSWRNIYNDFNL